jgi:hypothetical protein
MTGPLRRIEALEAIRRQQAAHAEVERLAALTGIPAADILSEAEHFLALSQATGLPNTELVAAELGVTIEELDREAALLKEVP